MNTNDILDEVRRELKIKVLYFSEESMTLEQSDVWKYGGSIAGYNCRKGLFSLLNNEL